MQFGTKTVLTISIIMSLLYAISNIDKFSTTTALTSIAVLVIAFMALTLIAIKIDTGAVYSSRCMNNGMKKNMGMHRLAQLVGIPGILSVGDLMNVYMFHTCNTNKYIKPS